MVVDEGEERREKALVVEVALMQTLFTQVYHDYKAVLCQDVISCGVVWALWWWWKL